MSYNDSEEEEAGFVGLSVVLIMGVVLVGDVEVDRAGTGKSICRGGFTLVVSSLNILEAKLSIPSMKVRIVSMI